MGGLPEDGTAKKDGAVKWILIAIAIVAVVIAALYFVGTAYLNQTAGTDTDDIIDESALNALTTEDPFATDGLTPDGTAADSTSSTTTTDFLPQ